VDGLFPGNAERESEDTVISCKEGSDPSIPMTSFNSSLVDFISTTATGGLELNFDRTLFHLQQSRNYRHLNNFLRRVTIPGEIKAR
jgi:hypothetical protein